MKRIILGSILTAGALVGFGCEASVQPAPVAGGTEIAVGEDTYYDRGGYVGDAWVWHDKGGREMREERTVHENRTRTRAQAKPQAEHHDEHQDSHEEHK